MAHVQATGHKVCWCGGYLYAHRPGSPLCVVNPLSALRLADRDGASDEDLFRCASYLEEENAGDDRVIEKIRAMLKFWQINQPT